MANNYYLQELELIKKDFCIGCGICTSTYSSKIVFDKYGQYKIDLISDISEEDVKKILKICPFSSLAINEEKIGRVLFESKYIKKSDYLGYYLNNFIGHVEDESIRVNSSSGGIITWLLTKLLENKEITHAVHVSESKSDTLLFEYSISKDRESVISGASSRYYPVEMSEVLKFIEKNEGEYAIVALPCFTKALRLLQQENRVFKERIKYIIAPICGHLKSKNYAGFLAWQKGVFPDNLYSINFRKKLPHRPAPRYGTEIIYTHNSSKKYTIVENSTYKMGTDWGHGMFKYEVCDYCDDVVGELADVSIGDAWLKEYIHDYKGNSVITIRNFNIEKLFLEGIVNKELNLEQVDPITIIQSQAGGFRNKREDLSYRLWLKEYRDEWHPPKRIVASKTIVNSKRRRVIKMRIKISQYSHKLFNKALRKSDLNLYYKKMTPLLDRYYYINNGLLRFLKYKIKKIL